MIFYLLCTRNAGDEYEIIIASLYLYYLIYLLNDENLFYGVVLLDLALLYIQNPLRPSSIRYSKKVDETLAKVSEKKSLRQRKRQKHGGKSVKFDDQYQRMNYNISDPPNYVQNYSYSSMPIEQRYEALASQYVQPQYVRERVEFQANNYAVDTRNQMSMIQENESDNFLINNTKNEYVSDTVSEMSVDNDII